jgi:hypothetical protein
VVLQVTVAVAEAALARLVAEQTVEMEQTRIHHGVLQLAQDKTQVGQGITLVVAVALTAVQVA